jgi:hypothetical protein
MTSNEPEGSCLFEKTYTDGDVIQLYQNYACFVASGVVTIEFGAKKTRETFAVEQLETGRYFRVAAAVIGKEFRIQQFPQVK